MPKNKNNSKKIIVMILAALLISLPLTGCLAGLTPGAQPSGSNQFLENTISVNGTGDVQTVPDQVLADIGIVTEKPTAQDAININSKISNQVIIAVQKINATNMTVESVGYNLNPLYDYSNENKPPRIYSYQVTSTIRVKTTDIGKIGKIIATATQAGATNISSVGFDLTDDTRKKAVNDALALATKDATDKANSIAESMGLKIDGVFYVTESIISPPVPIISMRDEAEVLGSADIVPPTILPSTLEVAANITAVFIFTK